MMFPTWVYFALGSAFFAGLTAIFGKIGVIGINSNLATFLRTIVVALFAGGIVFSAREWQNPVSFPRIRFSHRRFLALLLSGVATWPGLKSCSR
jgi:transporter family protein